MGVMVPRKSTRGKEDDARQKDGKGRAPSDEHKITRQGLNVHTCTPSCSYKRIVNMHIHTIRHTCFV